MKLRIIVDGKHRIVAVASMPAVVPNGRPVLVATPVCPSGYREHDVSVPEADLHRDPHEHLRALHVDAAGGVTYRRS